MWANLIHDAFESIISSSYISDITETLQVLVNGLNNFFSGNDLTTTLSLFRAVGASLMIIFFFIAISDCIQKDILSFDKFVVFMIRLYVGFMVIYFLPDIISGFFKITNGLYNAINSSALSRDSLPVPDAENFKEVLNWKGGFIKAFFSNAGSCLMYLAILAVGKFGQFTIIMFALSNALTLMARVIFSPIGVAQCFDEGSRSAGIRYLKLLLADMLAFAMVVGILVASVKLTNILLIGVYENLGLGTVSKVSLIPISQTHVLEKLVKNPMFVGSAFAVKLATIGGVSKASQLAKEVVGV